MGSDSTGSQEYWVSSMDVVGSRIPGVEAGFEAFVETSAGAQQWECAPAG